MRIEIISVSLMGKLHGGGKFPPLPIAKGAASESENCELPDKSPHRILASVIIVITSVPYIQRVPGSPSSRANSPQISKWLLNETHRLADLRWNTTTARSLEMAINMAALGPFIDSSKSKEAGSRAPLRGRAWKYERTGGYPCGAR